MPLVIDLNFVLIDTSLNLKFTGYFALLSTVNLTFQPLNNSMINGWNDFFFIGLILSWIDRILIPQNSSDLHFIQRFTVSLEIIRH